MTGIAFAAAPAGGAGAAGGFASFIPLILIFVVFYFLLIRPQQKQAKQHQKFLSELKKGSRVLTKGGIHGVIVDIDGIGAVSQQTGAHRNTKAPRDCPSLRSAQSL